MTEPVAYIYNYTNGDYALWHKTEQHIEKAIPLYTKEQLQPKVQMTQKEFDEFHSLLSIGIDTPYEALSTIVDDRGEMDEFEHLYSRLFTHDRMEQAKNQSDFSTLWSSLLGRNVKELVEIVPDMKWFVRNKQKGKDDVIDYLMISDDVWFGWHPFVTRDEATAFDTKEEAELWTNPLTEAVQLPVEGE